MARVGAKFKHCVRTRGVGRRNTAVLGGGGPEGGVGVTARRPVVLILSQQNPESEDLASRGWQVTE